MAQDEKVVDFPNPSEETPQQRAFKKAMRLANLTPGEWKLYVDEDAQALGIPVETLTETVLDILKDREKRAKEEKADIRRQEALAERTRISEQRREERERKTEQQRINKEAKEKAKALALIAKLPSDLHETKLAELARRLGEDVGAICYEFDEFCASEISSEDRSTDWDVEPWPEPVPTAELLQELINKITKHVIARPHEILAIALWTMWAWIHHVATHSPFLVITSVEPDSGKTTLVGVLGFLVPKPFLGAEPSGASIYRYVDREKPTLSVDDADEFFVRKTDVKHIFNVSWTRGTKIPRQVQGRTVFFDPFCPKIVGLLGLKMPRPLVGRSIVIKMWPKKPDETVTDFEHIDDEEFTTLRRKLSRWATDNATAAKELKPLLPAGFNNRLAANWRLPLAIAELAKGTWPKQARGAAERLSHTNRKPSWGMQLLSALRDMFAGRTEITSEEIVATLTRDPDSIWLEYRGKGPITQRQVADLLSDYDIYPQRGLHPTKRPDKTRNGYRSSQFTDVLARLLPSDPHIRTLRNKGKRQRSRSRVCGCADRREL
jgi:putative DNA primase/helicase